MAVAGISGIYRLGDPLNTRLCGLFVTEPETAGLPHWCVHVLNWLAMVNAMQNAHGDIGNTYRGMVKMALDGTGPMRDLTNEATGKRTWLHGPAAVYAIYQSFIASVEMEANRQRK